MRHEGEAARLTDFYELSMLQVCFSRGMDGGDLDEHALQSLLEQGAPSDDFGVCTRMHPSSDAPYSGWE